MWVICPKQDSELGQQFYDSGKFHQVLEKLEITRKNKFKVIQKKDTVRFAIQDIPDIEAAADFLKDLLHEEVTI
jgi:transcription-repair coupling factor (superfamily II helicase)